MKQTLLVLTLLLSSTLNFGGTCQRTQICPGDNAITPLVTCWANFPENGGCINDWYPELKTVCCRPVDQYGEPTEIVNCVPCMYQDDIGGSGGGWGGTDFDDREDGYCPVWRVSCALPR